MSYHRCDVPEHDNLEAEVRALQEERKWLGQMNAALAEAHEAAVLERGRLRDGIAAHRSYSEHYRSILWDGEVVSDLPHNEALWALLDGTT